MSGLFSANSFTGSHVQTFYMFLHFYICKLIEQCDSTTENKREAILPPPPPPARKANYILAELFTVIDC